MLHIPLRKAIATILTGLHFATLRPAFISVALSPSAAYNLACLAACFGCGFVMVFETSTQNLNIKNTFQTLAYNVATHRPFRALWLPPTQAHAVTSSRSSFQCLCWRHATCKPPFVGYPLLLFCRRRYYLLLTHNPNKKIIYFTGN